MLKRTSLIAKTVYLHVERCLGKNLNLKITPNPIPQKDKLSIYHILKLSFYV